MGAILSTLAVIAGSIGANWLVDRIGLIKARKGEVDTDTLIKTTRQLINEASKKGQNTLDKVTNQLNRLNYPFIQSPSVKNYIQSVRLKLSKKVDNIRDIVDAADSKLSTQSERLSNYMLENDVDKVLDKGIVTDIQDQVTSISKDLNKVEETLK